MGSMNIQYVGGSEYAFLGRIRDPRFRAWKKDEIKEVPDYDIDATNEFNEPVQENAIRAVLNHGFRTVVNADTGKNPMYQCADCGEHAESDFFRKDGTGEHVHYVNDKGDPLCQTCFLARYPEHLNYHKLNGIARGLLGVIEQKAAKLKAPAVSDRTLGAVPTPATAQPVNDEVHADA